MEKCILLENEILNCPDQYKFDISEISKLCIKNEFYSQKPIVISNLAKRVDVSMIEKHFEKQYKNSDLDSILVIELLQMKARHKLCNTYQNNKILKQIPLKALSYYLGDKTFCESLDDFTLRSMMTIIQGQYCNKMVPEDPDNIDELPWSLRFFPFHRVFNLVVNSLPRQIISLSQYDILSYQKVQKISNYTYIIAYNQYSQVHKQSLFTQVYVNWGQNTEIQFILKDKNGKKQKRSIKFLQLILIPECFSYEWKTKEKTIIRLLTWQYLPKAKLQKLLPLFDNSSTNSNQIPYALNQALKDYIFHEFQLIKPQNTDFRYDMATYLNGIIKNQEKILAQLNQDLQEIQNSSMASFDRRNYACTVCGQFLFNYFGSNKTNQICCMTCLKSNIQFGTVYKIMPTRDFEVGINAFLKFLQYRQKQLKQGLDVNKILQKQCYLIKHIDYCDGQFIGPSNNLNCKQSTKKKQKSSNKQFQIHNVIYLKRRMNIMPAFEILQKFSIKVYSNQAQKKVYSQIIKKASLFLNNQEEKKLLQRLIPDYQETNLKLMVVGICAKNML